MPKTKKKKKKKKSRSVHISMLLRGTDLVTKINSKRELKVVAGTQDLVWHP